MFNHMKNLKFNKSKQGGFTLAELVTSLLALLVVCGVIGLIWVVIHFILKFW